MSESMNRKALVIIAIMVVIFATLLLVGEIKVGVDNSSNFIEEGNNE